MTVSEKILLWVITEAPTGAFHKAGEVLRNQGEYAWHRGYAVERLEFDRTFGAVFQLDHFEESRSGLFAWWKDLFTDRLWPMNTSGIRAVMQRAEWPRPGVIDVTVNIVKQGAYIHIQPVFPEDTP